MSLVNWVLRSLMPEEGRERWGQGDREPEKRSCLFCCSVCSASRPAPSALTPEAAVAKGHIPGTRPGKVANRILAKLRVISGRQKEALLCHLLAV